MATTSTEFLVRELSVPAGSTLHIVRYGDNSYVQHTGTIGSPTSFYLNGEGDPLTIDGQITEVQLLGFANPLLVSQSQFITDNLGNRYGRIFLPVYAAIEVESGGEFKIVGRAPGGKFGRG